MPICPNCGRPLADGEVCNCTANVQPEMYPQPEQQYAPQPEQQYQPQPDYYAPQGQYIPPQPVAAAPAVKAPARTDYPEGYHIKRKYVAVLLAVWLGMFGIHNFYLGDSTKGIIHIVITTAGSLVFGIGYVASFIWAVVEAVQILGDYTDADANGFKIQTFEESLVKTRMEAEEKKKDE